MSNTNYIDESQITKIHYEKTDQCKHYSTELKDGGTLYATSFIAGPDEGWYQCYIYDPPGIIPLDDSMYTRLHNLYKAQHN